MDLSELDSVTGGAAGVPGLAARLDFILRFPRLGRSRDRVRGRQKLHCAGQLV